MKQSIPITVEFLNRILETAAARIQSITAERLGDETTYNANLWRVHLQWAGQAEGLPGTVVAKLPAANPDLNDRAAIFQPGARENWFYSLQQRDSSAATAKCYYNANDPMTNQSILLLEDLAPALPGSQRDGLDHAQAYAALTPLAQHHAFWWNKGEHPEVKELLEILGPASKDEAMLVQHFYDEAWPQFLTYDFVEMSDDVKRYGAAFVSNISLADEMLERPQKTLVHGDYRADNLLFATDDGLTCRIIDWEDLHWGSGALDVSWLLGSCLLISQVDQEIGLLAHYHNTLLAAGVTDYSFEQFMLDYRLTMSNNFIQGVLTANSTMQSTSPDPILAANISQRIIAAAQRLNLVELIP